METKTIMENKKQSLPNGFLSTDGKPTINSVVMYFIYLWTVPINWNLKELHLPSVEVVRQHFGVNYGFKLMIKWGISHGCTNSKTSSGRHHSMSEAFTLAKSLKGGGVQLGNVGMIELLNGR